VTGQRRLQPDEVKLLESYIWTLPAGSEILFPSNRTTPIDRTTLHKLMKQYSERAAIPAEKRHFHVWKHSIATHLFDAGADLAFVQSRLGHANIQNTLIYAQLTSTTRDEQARRLFRSPRMV